jgi:uncharacterized protein YjdB
MRSAKSGWFLLRHIALAMFVFTFGMGRVFAANVTLNATGGDGKIGLSWTVTGNLRGIQMMRDIDANPSGRQRVATLPGGARSYSDNTAANGRQYWYWIKYTDTSGITGNSNAASAMAGASQPAPPPDNGNAGATCANAVSLALPKVFTGVADTCLAVSGTIDNVNSWGAETVEINGVSYKSKWSNQMPARINGNYYIRYVAKQSWAHFEINGNGGTDNGGGNQPVTVTGVSVTPANVTLALKATTSLSATVAPNNATNKNVTWTSSNAGVATVSANGVVTGIAAGKATITVKTADGNRTATSTVTVTADKPTPTPGACVEPAMGTHGSNPIMPGIHTADPAVLVHNCTFYITAGHDEGTNGFYMRDWYVLSSTDMVNWSDNGGPVLSLNTFSWADANAWAGQMVERNGKFYWYVPVNERGGGMAIGVAVGDSPLGPFHDAIGAPLVNDAVEMRQFNYSDAGQTVYTIDPTVFVDDNGQAYLAYGGFGRMVTVALGNDMISLKGNMVERSPDGYFEAPYLTKRNGTYYMVYAAGVNPATIDYATANSPTGPWQYRGRILDALSGLPGEDAPTSHPAIAEFAGQWYLVYHLSNGPGGGTYRRQVAIDKLKFNADGTIQKVTPSSGLSFDDNGTGNRAPVAKIKSVAGVLAGGTVTLDGSASSDPNGDTLSYRWTQTQGSQINLANTTARTPSFVAPAVTQPTSFAFQLTVSDGSLSDSASVAFQVSPVSDTTAPSIVSRVPQFDQSGVSTTTAISVTFNEALREDRIDNQSLQVTENGNPVAGVVTYNSTNHTITTKLSRDLSPGTRYTVTLAGTLQDLAGNAASGESWSFTTVNGNVVGNCDFPEPPANVAAWVNESWNAQLASNIKSRQVWLLDSAMKGKGEINLCVRWGASRPMTAAIRDQIAPTMEKWFNGWYTALGSYGCFPYPKGVKVKLTGVAVKPNQKSLLQWSDNSVAIYTETDGEGEPKCPDACSFFENWGHEFPGCPGGEARHFDYSVWLDDTIGGGAGAVGGDWGLRIPVASFVDVLNQPSDHTIQHEMGHGFGMQDYYDWTGSTPEGGSAMIVGSHWGDPVITTGDSWLIRRIWKEQKAQRGW